MIGQDFFTQGVLADIVPFDPTLPYLDRPVSGLLINRGCPPGYFAQLVGAGEPGAVVVNIPGVVSNQAVRCRLMATSDAGSITYESGTTAAESLAIYTEAIKDTAGDIGAGLKFGLPWVALGLATLALLYLAPRR